MALRMLSQLKLIRELCIANRTDLRWLVFEMGLLVFLQVEQLVEGFLAYVANVRFLAGVYFFVIN